MVQARPILIMAGGTGGHIYPALAVADLLRERGMPLVWLGTRRGLETSIVPRRGYRLITIAVAGLRRSGWTRRLLAPFQLSYALGQALTVMLRLRPLVVLGMGGFASGPGGVAAWLCRIPLLIHEQNSILGVTNRILSRFATRTMEGFPGTFPKRCNAVLTGNPVRADISALPPPDVRFAAARDKLRVLVLGGSQGAKALNETMPVALALTGLGDKIEVWHQAGEKLYSAAVSAYLAQGVTARVEPYIEDMPAAYAWADLVVCRSGALTIAELAAAGVASILVPYPFAVDDHQASNARYLADAGAAILLPQHELRPERLAHLLVRLHGDRAALLDMARAARRRALPDAGALVAGICMEAAHA